MAINIESDTDLRVPKPVGHNDNWCARGLLRRENTLQYQAHSAKTQDLASPRQMGWSGCRDARSCVSTKAHPEKRIIAGDLASHSLYIVMRHLGVIMSLLQGPPHSDKPGHNCGAARLF